LPDNLESEERIAALEARVAALSATVKSVLTTLMLRGLLNRAEIAPLLAEAESMIEAAGSSPAAKDEIAGISKDLPAYVREAMGPPPDDDDHDH
jgi:hypothetical protein